MKFFVESIDKGIWDAITNCPFTPKVEKDKFLLENLGVNGLRVKVKKLDMIALPRILSLLP